MTGENSDNRPVDQAEGESVDRARDALRAHAERYADLGLDQDVAVLASLSDFPPAPSGLPLIVDTDIGGDPDDAVALMIAAGLSDLSPVLTCDEHEGRRARFAPRSPRYGRGPSPIPYRPHIQAPATPAEAQGAKAQPTGLGICLNTHTSSGSRRLYETVGRGVSTIGSLSLCRSLLRAGLVDRFRVVMFTAGVRHMFAELDLASGQMFYRIRDHKRRQEFLAFLKQLRRRFPAGRLYIVCDNYGPHTKAEVRAWCTANNLELVYTPSNASWLNWIECEFTALRYFTPNGSDYPNHAAQEAAIAGYIRWHNRKAQPKRHFAIGSKVRQPDYLPYAA